MAVITRQQAGLSNDAIWRRIKAGKWQELFPGIYLTSPAPATWEERLIAACKWAGGNALVSFRAAGKLFGFPGLTKPIVELTTERDVRSNNPDVVVHKTLSVEKRVRTRIGNIPVTTPTETILDLAAVLGMGELQAVVQYAIRHQLTTWNKLMVSIEASSRGRPGIKNLRRILIEGLDSHLERLFKRLVKASTLPNPVEHFKISTGKSRSYDVDFAYPAEMIAIETDGWAFHSDPVAFQRDRVRWRELGKVGWIVLCFTYEDVKLRPDNVIETIAEAIEHARRHRTADVLV